MKKSTKTLEKRLRLVRSTIKPLADTDLKDVAGGAAKPTCTFYTRCAQDA